MIRVCTRDMTGWRHGMIRGQRESLIPWGGNLSFVVPALEVTFVFAA